MQPFWYQNAVIYEADPNVFRDADGDGWGDIAGITEKLPYLRALGITCLWLLPIYQSPFRDDGYDVSDHLRVDPRLGTVADVVELIDQARALGIHVILDLVCQHTSCDHPWFQAARADRHSPYRDYYLWADEPKETPVKPIFPTVEDSVWAWDEQAGQYYRHVFYRHEPDLNLGNPAVREEIKRIVDFWLRLGVAGFRMDAASHVVETAREADPREDGFWILDELREHIALRYPHAILLGESDVQPEDYRAYLDGRRLTMVSDFWVNNHLFLALARQRAEPLVRALQRQPTPPPHRRYAYWARNHDELDLERLGDGERKEVLQAFAPEPRMQAYGRGARRRLPPMLDGDLRRIAMTYALVFALPGLPILRYGEEIGMGEDLDLKGRAAVRTAMQWSDAPHGGFCAAGVAPRVPVIDKGDFGYPTVNVQAQALDDRSLLSRIGRLCRARLQLAPLGARTARCLDAGCDTVLALYYELDGRCALTLTNLGPQEAHCRLQGIDAGRLGERLADGPYADGDPLTVRGYGYRWFELRTEGAGRGNGGQAPGSTGS